MSTATQSPALVLQVWLKSQSLVSIPEDEQDWPCYVGSMPDDETPASPALRRVNCVSINDTTGIKDGRLLKTGEVIEHPGIQIMVRASTFLIGRAKALAIAQALDAVKNAGVAIVSGTTHTIKNASRTGNILSLGAEPNSTKRREFFSINLLLTIVET